VLEVLVGEARKLRPTPVVEGLYDIAAWRRLWEQALASPVTPEAESEEQQPAEDAAACPYRGLAVFRQEDSAGSTGRERSNGGAGVAAGLGGPDRRHRDAGRRVRRGHSPR